MLFNSLGFLFVFLPVALLVYYLLIRFGQRRFIYAFFVLATLAFCAAWDPPHVLLLLGSVGFNYLCAGFMQKQKDAGQDPSTAMWVGVGANLLFLGYFKYSSFFLGSLSDLFGAGYSIEKILLPIAISFYTIQQIAFLVDVARGEARISGILRYATFVLFFPKLLAGPIVHYQEMMPQLFSGRAGRFMAANLTIGLAIFTLGLFKKTVIADSAALFATPVFEAVAAGQTIGLLSAWKAAITYTIQLYFDFSGYSDMAVGLARMFGIILPLNFHSPLKAASIIEYWRRWHITLQRFIVSYLYQPLVLPMTRFAASRGLGKWPSFFVATVTPTIIAFVVIGLWHGAAWTFVTFGLMHGIYVGVNEYWRSHRRKARKKSPPGRADIAFYHVLTLLAVMFANVMFRSPSVGDAVTIWGAMLRLDQLGSLPAVLPATIADLVTEPFALAVIAGIIIAFMPNTQQFIGRYRPVLEWAFWRTVAPPVVGLTWRPTIGWAIGLGIILFLGFAFITRGTADFIYLNF